MKILGILFLILGFLLTITIFLAWIGIPLMFIGAILVWAGRKPTVITNVIHNGPAGSSTESK